VARASQPVPEGAVQIHICLKPFFEIVWHLFLYENLC
jgi:hypothetical protein